MASRRGDAKTEVERIVGLFETYIDKPLVFSFGKFSFPDVVIKEIRLASVTKLVNKPENRYDENGKKYKPPVMELITTEGVIRFVVEDITVAAINRGLRISTAAIDVNFRKEE